MIELGLFHILRPYWLLGVPTALVALWILRRLRILSGITSIDQSLRAVMVRSSDNSSLPLVLVTTSIVLACIALSGPGWNVEERPLQSSRQATFIVFDLSFSMAATDTKPARYKRAQFKIRDFINRYASQGPFALISYAGDAHLVVPLTDDVATLNNFIDNLYPGLLPVHGSRPQSAIAMVQSMEQENNLRNSRVLLLTDGVQTNSIPTLAAQIRATGLQLAIIAVGEKSGIPIHTENNRFLRYDNGDFAFADYDFASLQELASASGGKAVQLEASDNDLQQLFGDSLIALNDNTIAREKSQFIHADQGYFLLFLIIPLVFITMLRGVLLTAVICLVFLPQESLALEWNELWLNNEYRAYQQYQQGNYQHAQKLTKSDNTNGATLYQQKKYRQALDIFQRDNSAIGKYNSGNSLMQLERYQEAIRSYQQALEQPIEDEQLRASAEKNLAIARQLLQQKQNEQGQNGENQQSAQNEQGQNGENQQSAQNEQGQNGENQQSAQNEQGQNGENQQSAQNEQGQNGENQQSAQNEQGQNGENQQSAQNEQGQNGEDQQHAVQANEGNDGKEDSQSLTLSQDNESFEQRSRHQLLLKLVEDKPGELLRRKFSLQQRRRNTQIPDDDPL